MEDLRKRISNTWSQYFAELNDLLASAKMTHFVGRGKGEASAKVQSALRLAKKKDDVLTQNEVLEKGNNHR